MKKLFIYTAILLLFSACETDITDEIDLGKTKVRLVVQGGIHHVKGMAKRRQEIILTESIGYFDTDKIKPVTDASVSIQSDQGDLYVMSHSSEKLGSYFSDSIQVSTGVKYTLMIQWKGEEYSATELMNTVAPIDSIYQTYEEETTFEDAGFRTNVDFVDPASEVNFYYWELYANGKNQVIPDPGNGGNLIQSDQFFNGAKIEGYQPNEEAALEVGQLIEVRQYGISQRYYDYLRTLFEQTTDVPGILDTPPAPLRGNIANVTNPKNFGLGYFQASEISSSSFTIQER